MGRKIKYMGTADNAVLEPGENFGGRLATPLTHRAEWTLANGHLVDTDEARLTDAAIALLLKDGRFVEVTDMEVIPSSLGQQMWQGHASAVPMPKDGPFDTGPTVIDGDGQLKVDALGGGLSALVPPADGPLVEDQTIDPPVADPAPETDESAKGKPKKP
jgi:hypothetical protein